MIEGGLVVVKTPNNEILLSFQTLKLQNLLFDISLDIFLLQHSVNHLSSNSSPLNHDKTRISDINLKSNQFT